MKLSLYGYLDIKQKEDAKWSDNRIYRHTMIAADVESDCGTPEEHDSLEQRVKECFGGAAIVTREPTGEMTIFFTVDHPLVSGTPSKPEFMRSTQERLESCLK